MVKLSIIVPIYGVEQYLRKCVDSLLNQDIPSSDCEIILVDDGGHDKCPQICDDYAAAYENIRVIHRENGGLSAARNSGIEIARGEYIMFVDSDDYLEPNVLSMLVKRMETDRLDVLRYNYRNVHADGVAFMPFKTRKPYFDYSSEVVDGETFLNERLGYACYATMFVIQREILKNCTFLEGIYYEDTDWTPRMLLKSKRASSTEMIVYNYLWREGSITLPDNPAKKKKVLEDKIKLLYGFQERRKFVKNQSWFMWQTAGTTMSILGILATFPASERKRYFQELKSLGIFPLTKYRADWKGKIKITIANLNPSLYSWLMSIIH